MNKEEFLKKLRKKIEMLEDSEVEDILSEYSGYIDEKVGQGMTEEEAVKELGDFNEIVSDLLAAYKVKTNNSEENGFNHILNKIGEAIDLFMDSLNNKSGKDIVRILMEIIIILFVICLLKIPFAMIRDLGTSIFYELSYPVGHIFSGIWTFIIEISYLIVAVIFFIKTFEKRYFKDITENIVNKREDEEIEESKTKASKKAPRESEPKTKEKKTVTKSRPSFFHYLNEICILFLKIIVMMILIGVVFYLIGMSVALGFMIYLIINGVKYFGILLLLIALFLGGSLFLELCINFLFNKRTKALFFVSKIASIIIVTGIGLTMSAIEIAETEIIYGSNSIATKSISKEIDMTDDLVLYNYDRVEIDNSLTDKVKIVYTYPDYGNNININIDLERHINGYILSTSIRELKWNKQILKTFISNLKDKKIYVDDYHLERVIYISDANYEILKNNLKNNYKNYNHVNTTFTRTYNITSIVTDDDNNIMYITVYPYGHEELITTAKVDAAIEPNLTTGVYEFTFIYTGFEFNDTPENIFQYCHLQSIIATDKTGYDQIQDNIY